MGKSIFVQPLFDNLVAVNTLRVKRVRGLTVVARLVARLSESRCRASGIYHAASHRRNWELVGTKRRPRLVGGIGQN